MAVELEIGKPLENNRVEVRASYNVGRRNFSVPEDKADEFVSTYRKKYNTASLISVACTGILGAAGGFLGDKLAKNATGWKQWAAVIAGGIAGYITATLLSIKPMTNLDKNIQAKFGAEEIKPS